MMKTGDAGADDGAVVAAAAVVVVNVVATVVVIVVVVVDYGSGLLLLSRVVRRNWFIASQETRGHRCEQWGLQRGLRWQVGRAQIVNYHVPIVFVVW